MKKAMLVYQAGIANVFQVQCFNLSPFGRRAKRLYMGDFRTAETFALGMQAAGATVKAVACNQSGNITNATWTEDLESHPFWEQFCPIH